MLYPLIGPRLHGWLDDAVVAAYVVGALALGLGGAALGIALGGAAVHFVLTRITNYPQGTFKLIPFRTHAFVELAEGVAVLVASFGLSHSPTDVRVFITFMAISQFVAFSFSDYHWPRPA
ncbi:MAG TPA: hypothetical protein VFH73_17370 [Polyangia bacterium]|jgi:hypothetical protein|nr:hypothetical protein [Polyangia bacterium]